ncbi:MAG: hypothetical protein GY817_04325 [bacterium]|nr:hypothetical protein [bacterium]
MISVSYASLYQSGDTEKNGDYSFQYEKVVPPSIRDVTYNTLNREELITLKIYGKNFQEGIECTFTDSRMVPKVDYRFSTFILILLSIFGSAESLEFYLRNLNGGTSKKFMIAEVR